MKEDALAHLLLYGDDTVTDNIYFPFKLRYWIYNINKTF